MDDLILSDDVNEDWEDDAILQDIDARAAIRLRLEKMNPFFDQDYTEGYDD